MASQKPLGKSKRQIRLLELASRNSTPFITCHLAIVDLEDNPKYEALSYVWGSTRKEDMKEARLDGAACTVITKNLRDALTTLRNKDKTRVLWVDAICINQLDHQERAHQVGIMDIIYASAFEVLIWLNIARLPRYSEMEHDLLHQRIARSSQSSCVDGALGGIERGRSRRQA
ncbi:hypothetical protein PG988_016014 [Apiospora saccharicola]